MSRLPVVFGDDPERLLGVIRRNDIVRACNLALTRRSPPEVQQPGQMGMFLESPVARGTTPVRPRSHECVRGVRRAGRLVPVALPVGPMQGAIQGGTAATLFDCCETGTNECDPRLGVECRGCGEVTGLGCTEFHVDTDAGRFNCTEDPALPRSRVEGEVCTLAPDKPGWQVIFENRTTGVIDGAIDCPSRCTSAAVCRNYCDNHAAARNAVVKACTCEQNVCSSYP